VSAVLDTSVDEDVVNYVPPGNSAKEFHASDAFVRGLMGPVGSGKSSSCCVEIMARALQQKPHTDGVRRSRWAIIRNTYPELKSTTIKTWETWFPSHVAPMRWDTPITSTATINDIGDGTSLELEVLFLALDKPSETGKLQFFRQPGGLYKEGDEYKPNPEAENIDNLPNGYTYYLNQLGGKDDNWINVFLLGNYGTTADGKPVYPEFNDKVHVASQKLEPIRGFPIILGWDFGLTPSCVVMQQTARGQVLVLKEIVSQDMGIRQFASDIVFGRRRTRELV